MAPSHSLGCPTVNVPMYSSWSCQYQLYNSMKSGTYACLRPSAVLVSYHGMRTWPKLQTPAKDETKLLTNPIPNLDPRLGTDKDVKLTGILELDRPCQPRAWPQGFLRCPSRCSLACQPPSLSYHVKLSRNQFLAAGVSMGPDISDQLFFFFFFSFLATNFKAQIGYTRLEGKCFGVLYIYGLPPPLCRFTDLCHFLEAKRLGR